MKLNTSTHKAEGSGLKKLKNFGMTMNAKAARVLSDTLYSDKFGSIIRELSCNAFDIHRAVGKADVPFDINLPDAFDSRLAIRDYGTGISPEDMEGVYCVFFESTKDDSNDDVGAFGLGCKTPFAYTDSFMVTSIYKGVKRIYNIFRDEGLPTLSEFGEGEETDEPDGLEVSVTVDPSDFSSFEKAVRQQLRFFPVKPNVNRNIKWPEITETVMSVDGFEYFKHSDELLSGFFIKQGPVAYPVDFKVLDSHYRNKLNRATPKLVKFLGELANQRGYYYSRSSFGAVLEMPIGTVEVNPGREAVSYGTETLDNIVAALDKVSDAMFKTITANLHSNYKKGYRAFIEYYNNLADYMQGTIDPDYIERNFSPFAIDHSDLKIKMDEKYAGVKISEYIIRTYPRKIEKMHEFDTGDYNLNPNDKEDFKNTAFHLQALSFALSGKDVYVKDEAYAFVKRASDNCINNRFVIIEQGSLDSTKFDEFIKLVENFSEVTLLSNTPKPARASTGGHSTTGGNKRSWFYLHSDRFAPLAKDATMKNTLYRVGCHKEYDETVDDYDGEQKVFLTTHNNRLYDVKLNPATIRVLMMYAKNVLGMNGSSFIAIPKNSRSKAEKNGNFIHMDEFFDQHKANIIKMLEDEVAQVRVTIYYGKCKWALDDYKYISDLEGVEPSDFDFHVTSDTSFIEWMQDNEVIYVMEDLGRPDILDEYNDAKDVSDIYNIVDYEKSMDAANIAYHSFTDTIKKIEQAMLDPVNTRTMMKWMTGEERMIAPHHAITDPFYHGNTALQFEDIINKIIDRIA